MFGTILSILKGAVSLFNKVSDYLAKKDMENQIKNRYEKNKKIETLEQNEKVRVLIKESEEQVKRAKEAIRNVSKVTEGDANLSEEQTQKVLAEIVDPEDKEAREEQIKMAKKIKEEADKKITEIEKNEKFNSGEEITFKG